MAEFSATIIVRENVIGEPGSNTGRYCLFHVYVLEKSIDLLSLTPAFCKGFTAG